MASNAYHFVTQWRVQGTVQEVREILADVADLVRWWPSVYIEVREVESGRQDGVGSVFSLYTRGWLPYILHWFFRVTESRSDGSRLEAWGDFVGQGIWTFAQDGAWVHATYDWEIMAEKPLLRYLSFMIKPIFAANHRWAMARGEESLRLELARRHATSAAARARVPAPPAPTTTSSSLLLAGTLGIIALAGGIFYAMSRRPAKP